MLMLGQKLSKKLKNLIWNEYKFSLIRNMCKRNGCMECKNVDVQRQSSQRQKEREKERMAKEKKTNVRTVRHTTKTRHCIIPMKTKVRTEQLI